MLATWSEADAYAQWVGGRLPTEAEWEYADSTFHPVKLLKPNELGLYDMTGNLSEWVSDWYNPEKEHLSGLDNPKGPPEGEEQMKISKGWGWYYDSEGYDGKPLKFGVYMPELRYQSPIETRTNGFGFRVAKD